MNNTTRETIALLYDFDDPIRVGLIVKILSDLGIKNITLIIDEFIMKQEYYDVFSKYVGNSINNIDYSETSRPIIDEVEDYKDEGYKIVGFTTEAYKPIPFTETKIPAKSCLVIGANEKSLYLHEDLFELFDYKLSYPRELSANPDEISKAVAMVGRIDAM